MTLFEFFTLLGGVGLFLYGMSLMSQGLKLAAGNKLRSILEHATDGHQLRQLRSHDSGAGDRRHHGS